jgi:2-polyprenyl-3-methyl-5-hydroxy-6-metoxy-1,4-benzoquinol methylase
VRDYRQVLYDAYVVASPEYYRRLADPVAFETLRRFYRSTHGPWLPRDRKARILEVGCGSGQFCYFLQKEGYAHFEGIDASPQMLDVCRAMGVPNVRHGEALAYLAANPGAFDAIVANDFIEHLTKNEILDFLAHARTALRSGGRLVMKTPNAGCVFGARDRYVDFTHEVAFTAESAQQVLIASGFGPVRVLPVVGAAPRGLRSWGRFLVWTLMLRPLFALMARVMIGPGPHILTINLLLIADRQ